MEDNTLIKRADKVIEAIKAMPPEQMAVLEPLQKKYAAMIQADINSGIPGVVMSGILTLCQLICIDPANNKEDSGK